MKHDKIDRKRTTYWKMFISNKTVYEKKIKCLKSLFKCTSAHKNTIVYCVKNMNKQKCIYN